MAARTEEEIRQSLIESLQAEDPSIDVVKGPVYDYLLKPVPAELQVTEEQVDRLSRLVTLQIDQVVDDNEISSLATTFGITLPRGTVSTGDYTFFSFNEPSTGVTLRSGEVVGTRDGNYQYYVTTPLEVAAGETSGFFVASRRRYEWPVRIAAVAVGADYNLPPTRINRVFTSIEGIDGGVNLTSTAGGADPEDFSAALDRVRAALAGLDPETGGGLITEIYSFDPEAVLTVSLVYPRDRPVFARPTNRPAIDAYVNGTRAGTHELTLTAVGGEQTISLTAAPVLSVDSVEVNGSAATFTFVQDESPETGGSARADDRIVLTNSLSANDVLVVEYTSNDLHYELQTERLDTTDSLFSTDVLARQPNPVGLEIVLDAVVLPSVDVTRTGTALASTLSALIETGQFRVTLVPKVIEDRLKDFVGGLAELVMVKFKRTSLSTADLETVTIGPHQNAVIDGDLLRINVRA